MINLGASLTGLRTRWSLIRAKLVFLHIGKTGGMTIKRANGRLRDAGIRTGIRSMPHRWTANDVLRSGTRADLGVVIRPPEDRFQSAFDSRLRRGRPSHDIGWSAAEATVFNYFPTANDLAEALDCSDRAWLPPPTSP